MRRSVRKTAGAASGPPLTAVFRRRSVRPGILKAGTGVRVLKQETVPLPEAAVHLRPETLMNGALHAALYRGPEGLPLFV